MRIRVHAQANVRTRARSFMRVRASPPHAYVQIDACAHAAHRLSHRLLWRVVKSRVLRGFGKRPTLQARDLLQRNFRLPEVFAHRTLHLSFDFRPPVRCSCTHRAPVTGAADASIVLRVSCRRKVFLSVATCCAAGCSRAPSLSARSAFRANSASGASSSTTSWRRPAVPGCA